MRFKYYIGAIISNIALLFYYMPWTLGATHTALGFYIIAFLWFIGLAWLLMLGHIIFGIKYTMTGNPNGKHHLIAAALIGVSYVGLIIGMANDYVVTV